MGSDQVWLERHPSSDFRRSSVLPGVRIPVASSALQTISPCQGIENKAALAKAGGSWHTLIRSNPRRNVYGLVLLAGSLGKSNVELQHSCCGHLQHDLAS